MNAKDMLVALAIVLIIFVASLRGMGYINPICFGAYKGENGHCVPVAACEQGYFWSYREDACVPGYRP